MERDGGTVEVLVRGVIKNFPVARRRLIQLALRFSFGIKRIVAERLDRFGVPILIFWCLLLFFYGISVGTLYRTESLRAIIGQSALDGHWLAPTLYGEPFLTKPPGMYAAIGLASLPFGRVTEVSARLPSVIAATVLVLAFFLMLRNVLGQRTAFLIALLMPTSLVWLDKSPSAEIDMLLVMWVALALLCFPRILEAELSPSLALRANDKAPGLLLSNCDYQPLLALRANDEAPGLLLSNCDYQPLLALRANDRHPQRAIWWIAALLCVTFGFLTKWTAPAFFYVTVIPLLWQRRQLNLLWSWRHLLAVGIAGLVVISWACAVAAQTGWDLLIDTILREARQRFQPGHNGKPYPWKESLAYPFLVLAALLPWSILALSTLRQSVLEQWDDKTRRFIQLCHFWVWPNLLFWTLPGQHAVRYALPIAPGLIVLGIMGLLSLPKLRRPLVIAAIVVIWLGVKIAYVEMVLPKRTERSGVKETATALAKLVPEGNILYLCHIKDEGILFYYGRPARRFDAAHKPADPFYAVLLEQEFKERESFGSVETVAWLHDQQGAAFALVKVHPHANPNQESASAGN
jgi:4-amino-4-deoxy-L-arabinose transferase-like glycosyltransferase